MRLSTMQPAEGLRYEVDSSPRMMKRRWSTGLAGARLGHPVNEFALGMGDCFVAEYSPSH
jgi:hypothetical protein